MSRQGFVNAHGSILDQCQIRRPHCAEVHTRTQNRVGAAPSRTLLFNSAIQRDESVAELTAWETAQPRLYKMMRSEAE